MADVSPFCITSTTTLIVAATTTAAIALPTKQSPAGCSVRIRNISATINAFVNFGSSTVTAVIPTAGVPAAGMPIGFGETEVVTVGAGVTHMAAITPSSTADIHITIGNGD
jgi:hypothetical protein